MQRKEQRLTLPNPHKTSISVDLLVRILKQAGITREEWLSWTNELKVSPPVLLGATRAHREVREKRKELLVYFELFRQTTQINQ